MGFHAGRICVGRVGGFVAKEPVGRIRNRPILQHRTKCRRDTVDNAIRTVVSVASSRIQYNGILSRIRRYRRNQFRRNQLVDNRAHYRHVCSKIHCMEQFYLRNSRDFADNGCRGRRSQHISIQFRRDILDGNTVARFFGSCKRCGLERPTLGSGWNRNVLYCHQL